MHHYCSTLQHTLQHTLQQHCNTHCTASHTATLYEDFRGVTRNERTIHIHPSRHGMSTHQWRLPQRHAWVCCGCVASVLQRVSVCCSVLCPSMEAAAEESLGLLLVCCRCMAVCCRMLQCVAPINVGCHRSMPGCAVVRCRALKFAAECCSVL